MSKSNLTTPVGSADTPGADRWSGGTVCCGPTRPRCLLLADDAEQLQAAVAATPEPVPLLLVASLNYYYSR
jgi:hypothetical protein